MADNVTPRGFVIGAKPADDDAENNKYVESLFFNQLSRRIELDSFAFRKQVILQAFNAFGQVPSFNHWYSNQFTSPYLTDMHVAFLRDMLKFMLDGTRRYNLETWDSILSREDVLASKNPEMDDEIEHDFFGISSPGMIRKPISVKIPDVVKAFMKQPNGTSELIYTLYILFGKNYQDQKPRFEPL